MTFPLTRHKKGDPALVRRVLEDLPDWFALPQAVAQYATQAADLPMISVQSGSQIIGFATVTWPQPQTMEIACMGVLTAFHGKGAGRALMKGIMALARDSGARLLLVRTLGPSDPDPHFARTRAFYAACGFLPVAEYPQIWGPENPCPLMVLPIATH